MQVDCFDLDGVGVDLTVVHALVAVLYAADVQVPVLRVRALDTHPFIVDDPAIFKGQ